MQDRQGRFPPFVMLQDMTKCRFRRIAVSFDGWPELEPK
jgi:hypothetical protein